MDPGPSGDQQVKAAPLCPQASHWSSVSLKSDHSKELPPVFSPEPGPASHSQSGLSAVSLKSDHSKGTPPVFSPEPGPASQGLDPEDVGASLDVIFPILEKNVLKFVQQELQRIHRLLASDYPECSGREKEPSTEVLNITLDFLKRMDQERLAQRLQHRCCVGVYSNNLKTHLQQRFSRVFEGVAKAGDSAPLTQIYTELYITEGGASEVNQEHEVRHVETASRRPAAPETIITCEELFKPRPHSPQPIRLVLTKGVAGVGKTVLTQKFSLDWAEGRAHQDLHLLFPFTFRDLNVLRDTQFSLVELLHHFFSPSKHLCSFQQLQVLFIFDGLDECRLPLDFSQTRVLTDPTESTSVHVLLVNLIRGSLLPSALLWITTRPAAANQIPAWCVSMVTEVRGFTDPQKEQYFRKRFTDQATAVISHIKSVRSLHIMSHLPIFCWILSTVLQKLLEQTEEPELPRTLTQMYIHFLVVQLKQKNVKYDEKLEADSTWSPENEEMVKSLGKLAFEQLQKGNLIFYESDLSECGLDAAAASVYSGVFTQVFREEPGLYQDKVYCFIHLSVQEFLAALHVHLTFYSSGKNLLETPHSSDGNLLSVIKPKRTKKTKKTHISTQKTSMSPDPEEIEDYSDTNDHFSGDYSFKAPKVFYRFAVDQALQSPNGHLDLFLRFLLGLSLSTNQHLLQGLVTHTGSGWRNQRLLHSLRTDAGSLQTNVETVKYIRQKLNEGVSAERSLNLLHCLNELNDHSLVQEIQKVMSEGRLSDRDMSPAEWTALCFLLLLSDSDLKEFNLHEYCASEDVLLRLLPLVRVSKTALLKRCHLSSRCCAPLASVLSSSSLTHLDLSDNDVQDSGVELLCAGLKSAPCRLETLSLSGCLVSERGGAALASALSSASSHLRELDLSYNHPGPSTELLIALRDDPHRPLQSVRLKPSGAQWMTPGLHKYHTDLTLDPDTVNGFLQLSDDQKTVTSVKEEQLRPFSSERFQWPQVLSSSPLRGRCFWEVEWSGGLVDVAVSYRGIQRRGKRSECEFGRDHQSWCLRVSVSGFSVRHNNHETVLSSSAPSGHSSRSFSSGRVAVLVDSDSLSFFDLFSGSPVLLHTYETIFTEPVFAGFCLWNHGTSVTLVDVNSATRRKLLVKHQTPNPRFT
ncbi:NACHT, LRR and PYD domains-containing protein 12-like isoform X2 [Boleophthalmus pectinirostris]|uniref:NACHT, LRR and PYD domains-containing protein 12-like isoform X2 n=1 Tax=Boleophthalmus pectinirostris TaxID=150288 RepID=UPI00242EF5AE|nr:NACHT, LRR and PYD domains-containing protein 12-like isoform X2 [Boleophthalmus pectinirostris]XP_055008417.1 NACHT, LRR and PYD domains-containing protein 12-like isoform X2 [Boleophthalmus pectinirostris]